MRPTRFASRLRARETSASPEMSHTGTEPRIVVLGPTASGKSDVAMAVARAASGTVDIVAADSMQVYRRMDIGTAKPTTHDRAAVRHHCIDVAEPGERYTVARYVEDLTRARADIASRGAAAVLVGGTGLYVTAAIDGLTMPGEWPEIRAELEADDDTTALYARLVALDEDAAGKIEPSNRRRIIRALEVCLGSGERFSSFGDGVASFPPSDVTQIGIRWERDTLRTRIAERVEKMIEHGLVDEVSALLAEDPPMSATARQALGYKEMIEHLQGEISLEEAIAAIILRTQQFAVRQERWFRRDPRIQWIDVLGDPVEEITPTVLRVLA